MAPGPPGDQALQNIQPRTGYAWLNDKTNYIHKLIYYFVCRQLYNFLCRPCYTLLPKTQINIFHYELWCFSVYYLLNLLQFYLLELVFCTIFLTRDKADHNFCFLLILTRTNKTISSCLNISSKCSYTCMQSEERSLVKVMVFQPLNKHIIIYYFHSQYILNSTYTHIYFCQMHE